jgi:tellurite resistance protein TehA-like permease
VNVKAGVLFHALAAIPGLVLSGLVLYRYRKHWPILAAASAGRPDLSWDYRALVFYLIPVATGCGLALSISSGSLFFLVLAAMGTVLIPWTKITVCRDHFFLSSALVGTGALPGLLLPSRSAHPLYYPVAAWALLSIASTLIIFVILIHRDRLDRMPASGY